MQLHHAKHHQAYVTNLNVAQEKMHEAAAKNDVKTQITLQPGRTFVLDSIDTKSMWLIR